MLLHGLAMGLPDHPVTLSPSEINEIEKSLADLRHNVNNHVALIMASVELMRRRPEVSRRTLDSVASIPAKITDQLRAFSAKLEKALQITRD
jgi:hypothetical protein